MFSVTCSNLWILRMLGNGICLSKIHSFASGFTWQNAPPGAFPLLPGWGCGDGVVSCLSNVQAAAVLGGAASMRDNMQMQWGTQL